MLVAGGGAAHKEKLRELSLGFFNKPGRNRKDRESEVREDHQKNPHHLDTTGPEHWSSQKLWQAIKPANVPAWSGKGLAALSPGWGSTDVFWGLGQGESVFFKGINLLLVS